MSPSDCRTRSNFEALIVDAESALFKGIHRKDKKKDSCKLPLILIDDVMIEENLYHRRLGICCDLDVEFLLRFISETIGYRHLHMFTSWLTVC